MLKGNQLRMDGAQVDEIDHVRPSRTRFCNDRLVTPSESPGAGSPRTVKPVTKSTLQPMHARNQVSPGRFECQVILVRLQGKRMELPLHATASLKKAVDEHLRIVRSHEKVRTAVTTIADVV
jgi:hypothetical protein